MMVNAESSVVTGAWYREAPMSLLLYLAKGAEGLPQEAQEHLAAAELELERVSHITRQTLGFFRESRVPDKIDVPALLESVLRLHSNKLKTKNISLVRHFTECPPIQGGQAVTAVVAVAADGTVLASSAPSRYPPGEAAASELPAPAAQVGLSTSTAPNLSVSSYVTNGAEGQERASVIP